MRSEKNEMTLAEIYEIWCVIESSGSDIFRTKKRPIFILARSLIHTPIMVKHCGVGKTSSSSSCKFAAMTASIRIHPRTSGEVLGERITASLHGEFRE